MNRTNTIKYAIQSKSYNSYLELGCETDGNFNNINCKIKVGVDSSRGGTLRMTTDDFFATNDKKFDLIFIDACHHHDQVIKDFNNSINSLSSGGMIIMHDCNPIDARHELQDKCGTVWKVMVSRIRTDKNLDAIVGDYDHGVGVVKIRNNEDLITIDKDMNQLTYNDLQTNRKNWLRIKNWNDVTNWIDS